MPPIISFIGRPNCGKTTVLEKLIPALKKRGFRVGTIKHHIHDFAFDTPGKDSWRHKQAGAHCAALSSPTGLGINREIEHDPDPAEFADRYFYDVDIIICEGYKTLKFPKIEVFRAAAADSPMNGRDDTWAAFISDSMIDPSLPIFAFTDIDEITEFIITTFIQTKTRPKATLLVDGRPIPLNSFVESFLRRSITGMTASLKGCRQPAEITITIRNDNHED